MTMDANAELVFDVGQYVQHAYGPFDTPGSVPRLAPDLVQVLRYVQHCFEHTGNWLAHVLVTPTHKDARITAFLSTWAWEQHWASVSLGILTGGGEVTVDTQFRNTSRLHLGPLREAILANVHGQALTGVQMCEQLISSWLLEGLLAQVQARLPAAAASVVAQIRESLARQQAFFHETATRELLASEKTRRLAKRRLARNRFPLGAAKQWSDRTLIWFGFVQDERLLQGVQARVNTLPGLQALLLHV